MGNTKNTPKFWYKNLKNRTKKEARFGTSNPRDLYVAHLMLIAYQNYK